MSEVKRLKKIANKIYKKMEALHDISDSELKGKTDEFRMRLRDGESLKSLMPDAYAAVAEAAYRVTGMRPYKVQLMGAVAMNEGEIAELVTGEGKTLVAIMPAYLNALEGKGVHVVTVNDYLAARDAKEIGRIHEFMGLSVGCVLKTTSYVEKKKEYAKDITYITNTELGFDYLRDNMAQREEDKMQRGHHFCIIDEVDSVLIDEAKVPLIVSGGNGKSTKLYTACNELVKTLEKGETTKELTKLDMISGEDAEETGDYVVNEKDKIVTLTERGFKKCEEFFGISNLASSENTEIFHNISMALKAHALMHKDKEYTVKNGEVLIVDEFTGRIQPGRRYSDGLHQAIEAKEGVQINGETETFASVTYQNFFNKYEKKCGMTGTAYTERKEFKEVYHMHVVRIPTNLPVIRDDREDKLYLSKEAKFAAVVQEIKKSHEIGQPVLIGTSTINDSEILDEMLKKEGLQHTVLNAKFVEKEAEIISHAGEEGSITIATNMAGRGTDIKLDARARAAGGLKVIGTQRHESRRIDNQLKGRSGRQGDPGESVFYLSVDDELLRIYGADKVAGIFKAFTQNHNECISGKRIDKFVNRSQKIIEERNFGARKNVLEMDEVNNEQRELIYAERDAMLDKIDSRQTMMAMIEDSINKIIDKYAESKKVSQAEFDDICKEVKVLVFGIKLPAYTEKMTKTKFSKMLISAAKTRYAEREREWPNVKTFRELERQVILKCIDESWKKHLNNLEVLKQNISLVGYGQKNPTTVYRIKAFNMFEVMTEEIKNDAVYTLFSSMLASVSRAPAMA